MSIGQGLTFVTGETGSGKTARVVDWLMDIKDRPIFVMGIPELKVEHQPTPPVDEWVEMRPSEEDPTILLPYFTFPPMSIVVIDEVQRLWRPRPNGSKPPIEVQAFETRRHVGVDFVIMSQLPMLVDANVRKLVNRHIHIHSTFLGRYQLEWKGPARDIESKTDRAEASRKRYSPPKRAFPMYKSAEVHTKVKISRPWQIYIALPLVVALVWGSWYMLNKLGIIGERKDPQQAQTSANHAPKGQGAPKEQKAVLTPAQYVAAYVPRIEGVPHTAPAYDDVTRPVEAPIPSGCIDSKKGCKCYTQQGTRYETTDAICRQIVATGFFIDFKRPEPLQPVASPQTGQGGHSGASSSPAAQIGHSYGSGVGQLQGESHNFAGGFTAEPKRQEPTYTLRPAG